MLYLPNTNIWTPDDVFRPPDFALADSSLSDGLQLAILGRLPGSPTAFDSSPFDRHGTLTGMVPATAWQPYPTLGRHCITTDGSDDYVDCGFLPLEGLTQCTMAGWVYRAATGTTAGFGTQAPPYRFKFTWYTDDKFYVGLDDGVGTGAGTSAAVALVGWHHVVIQFDGTQATAANRLNLWLDGAAISLTASGVAFPTALPWQSKFMIGRDFSSGAYRYWAGPYADVGVWSRLLTAHE